MSCFRPPLAALLAVALVFPGEAVARVLVRAVPARVAVPVVPVARLSTGLSARAILPSLGLRPAVAPSLSVRPIAAPPALARPGGVAASEAAPAALPMAAAAIAEPAAPAAAARARVESRAVPRASAPRNARRAFQSLSGGAAELGAAGRQRSPAGALSGISARIFDGAGRREAAYAFAAGAGRGFARSRSGLARSELLPVAAAGGALAAAPLWAPELPSAADAGFWGCALEWSGTGGYWLGNALAMAFPIPQIYATFRAGDAGKTPIWRAVVGAAASLAGGLVLATVAGRWFWGVQNLFGALTLLAPLLIGKLLRGRPQSPQRALWLTVATSLTLLLPSAGLYFAAASVVPGLLAGVLAPAGVDALALGLQIATGAMYLLLFAPDILALMRGRAPKGFTSLVSLLFFVSSAGFVLWTLQMAAAAPAGAERAQFLIYAAQNALYALVSFISFFLGRREERSARLTKGRIGATPMK